MSDGIIENDGNEQQKLSIQYHSGNLFWGVHSGLNSTPRSYFSIWRSSEDLDFYEGSKYSCFEVRQELPLVSEATFGYVIAFSAAYAHTVSDGSMVSVTKLY